MIYGQGTSISQPAHIDCARNDIKVIQLTGWNSGGQDRGNPSHNTDPRLGTHEDLRQAIKRIEKMGIRVVLFQQVLLG